MICTKWYLAQSSFMRHLVTILHIVKEVNIYQMKHISLQSQVVKCYLDHYLSSIQIAVALYIIRSN